MKYLRTRDHKWAYRCFLWHPLVQLWLGIHFHTAHKRFHIFCQVCPRACNTVMEKIKINSFISRVSYKLLFVLISSKGSLAQKSSLFHFFAKNCFRSKTNKNVTFTFSVGYALGLVILQEREKKNKSNHSYYVYCRQRTHWHFSQKLCSFHYPRTPKRSKIAWKIQIQYQIWKSERKENAKVNINTECPTN